MTGVLLASVMAALGLFLIPARKRQAKLEMRLKIGAMRALRQPRAIILTDANAPTVDENEFTIEVRSLAEWLLTGV